MSNKPNIVFYSKNCNASKNLLMIMKNINILNNFILYCIEDKKVPNGIKIVPTLLVSSINKPLEGVNAFKWVENIKFLRKDNISKKEIGPNGYYNLEMNGFSDKYSQMNNEDAHDQSYHSLNKKKTNGIFTAPEKNKLNKDEYSKELEQIKNIRITQEKDIKNVMKKQQIAAIIKDENKNKL
jgi:hypothetical protein